MLLLFFTLFLINFLIYFFYFQNGENTDTIRLHINLGPSQSSEVQFAFEISDVSFPQKLKSSLTYIIEVFKINKLT